MIHLQHAGKEIIPWGIILITDWDAANTGPCSNVSATLCRCSNEMCNYIFIKDLSTVSVSCPQINFHASSNHSIASNLTLVNKLSRVGNFNWTEGIIQWLLVALPCPQVHEVLHSLPQNHA